MVIKSDTLSSLLLASHILKARAISTYRSIRGIPLESFSVFEETPIRTFYEGPVFDPLRIRPGLKPVPGIPASGLHPDASPVDIDCLLGNAVDLTVLPEES